MRPEDVVGRYLIARENVPVYNFPNGTRIGELKKAILRQKFIPM